MYYLLQCMCHIVVQVNRDAMKHFPMSRSLILPCQIISKSLIYCRNHLTQGYFKGYEKPEEHKRKVN